MGPHIKDNRKTGNFEIKANGILVHSKLQYNHPALKKSQLRQDSIKRAIKDIIAGKEPAIESPEEIKAKQESEKEAEEAKEAKEAKEAEKARLAEEEKLKAEEEAKKAEAAKKAKARAVAKKKAEAAKRAEEEAKRKAAEEEELAKQKALAEVLRKKEEAAAAEAARKQAEEEAAARKLADDARASKERVQEEAKKQAAEPRGRRQSKLGNDTSVSAGETCSMQNTHGTSQSLAPVGVIKPSPTNIALASKKVGLQLTKQPARVFGFMMCCQPKEEADCDGDDMPVQAMGA